MFNNACQAVTQNVAGSAAYPSAMSSFAFPQKSVAGPARRNEKRPMMTLEEQIDFVFDGDEAVVPRVERDPTPVPIYEDISDAEEEDEDAILDALVRSPAVSGIDEPMEEYWDSSLSEPAIEEEPAFEEEEPAFEEEYPAFEEEEPAFEEEEAAFEEEEPAFEEEEPASAEESFVIFDVEDHPLYGDPNSSEPRFVELPSCAFNFGPPPPFL